jgi:hypothetical protein
LARKRQEVFTMTRKYRYIVVVLLSAAAVTVFATRFADVWDLPSPQPRALLVFPTPEGMAVVPAE